MIRHVLLRVLLDCEVGNPLSNPKHTAEVSQQEEGGFHTARQLFQCVIHSLHLIPTT